MFSLLITVIAIALTAVLIFATMYYGGSDTFNKGNEEAIVAKGVNEIEQIQTATYTYHALRGEWPESLDDLVPNYMRTLLNGWEGGGVADGFSYKTISFPGDGERTKALCQSINDRMKLDLTEPPSCSSLTPGFMGCCLE